MMTLRNLRWEAYFKRLGLRLRAHAGGERVRRSGTCEGGERRAAGRSSTTERRKEGAEAAEMGEAMFLAFSPIARDRERVYARGRGSRWFLKEGENVEDKPLVLIKIYFKLLSLHFNSRLWWASAHLYL